MEAIFRAEEGLIDADLVGNILKQRIARKGQGLFGGF
ncbi:type II toxin-antitoxin system RelE/ParE family toxin [Haemophilus paraphrohaemolyticus]|nr:type II toxin-antitoxin system RelE/ParE family toxin [Haemophilus paraphrohaemolyticus]